MSAVTAAAEDTYHKLAVLLLYCHGFALWQEAA